MNRSLFRLCLSLMILAASPRVHAQDPDFSSELPRIDPLSPEQALETFQLDEGFRLEILATEPLLHDPVALDFDASGDLFVVEMRGYSEDEEENLGRVSLLHDADGDGRYDTSTPYVDGLSWPTGVLCFDGGIFVAVAPDILYCKDDDGDGRADKVEKIFSGFGRQNVQGLVNSLRWGLDNRIHGTASSNGGKIKNHKIEGAADVVLSRKDFAFNPRTFEFSATSGGAQHGMSFDDWGRKFVSSNSDHLQMVMYDLEDMARNPNLAVPGPRKSIAADGPQAEVYRISPIEPWRIVRTRLRVAGDVPGPIEGGGRAAGYFTGSTGVVIYRGDAWPDEFRGNAFIGDVGSNIVHRKTLHPDGVGFVGRRVNERSEFLASSDTWFRPAQFANAPDGNLLVIDVYREVIEHPDSLPPIIKKHLDLTSGRDRGRIYRIVREGYEYSQPTDLSGVSVSELVRTLGHKNAWHRETASRLLYERQDASATNELRDLLKNTPSALARMHAMYVLDGLGNLAAADVSTGLADESPRVREHAVRLAKPMLRGEPQLRKPVLDLVSDPDIRVRYAVAFALGLIESDARADALADLMKQPGNDRWVRLAVLSSAHGQVGDVLALLTADSDWRDSAEGLTTLEELARQFAREGAQSTKLLFGLLGDAESDALFMALMRGYSAGTGLTGDRLSAALGKSGSQKLSARLASFLDEAISIAMDSNQPNADRVRAIDMMRLGKFEAVSDELAALVTATQPDSVQRAAFDALKSFRHPQLAQLLFGVWRKTSPSINRRILSEMLSREDSLGVLLESAEEGRFPIGHLDALQRQRLRNHPNKKLRARGVKLMGVPAEGRAEVIDRYKVALETDGDAERGRAIFRKTCTQCHQLEGEGHQLGPNLATIKHRGAETILLQVLDPNREINPEFLNYVVETHEGQLLSGIISDENASSVTLARGGGESDIIARSEIKNLRPSGISMMPEELEADIDEQSMADLLAYLMTVE